MHESIKICRYGDRSENDMVVVFGTGLQGILINPIILYYSL